MSQVTGLKQVLCSTRLMRNRARKIKYAHRPQMVSAQIIRRGLRTARVATGRLSCPRQPVWMALCPRRRTTMTPPSRRGKPGADQPDNLVEPVAYKLARLKTEAFNLCLVSKAPASTNKGRE